MIAIIKKEELWRKYELDKIKDSWKEFFNKKLEDDYLSNLLVKIEEEYKKKECYPEKKNVFRIFKEINPEEIKVVIVGQDPYHKKCLADGRAFSTEKENYIPASLRNIFKELASDLEIKIPKNGDLTFWVEQGVFLINSALTVRENEPLSHYELWKEFIFSLLIFIDEKNKNIIWVLWGKKAEIIKEICQIKEKWIIKSAHPSPFSAEKGFFGSRPFSRINKILKDNNLEEIIWTKEKDN